MLSTAVDGLVANLSKKSMIAGYASRSRDGIRFMDLGQSLIRYRIAGKGPKILVFVTDPPIVIEHYDYLVNLLKADYQVVIFEPPGFGFSIPSLRFDYRFKSLVDVIEAFLENLSLGPVTFVAPCVLGYGGIGLAHRRPDLIRELVLSQVPSWAEILKWKHHRDPKGLLSIPVLSQLLLKRLKKQRTPLWFDLATGHSPKAAEFNEIAQQAFEHGALFNLASGFQKLLVPISPLPTGLAVKTLFLWGEKDASHCRTCKESSLDMIPHAQLIQLPDAGHFPELEVSDTFAAHLESFLQTSFQQHNGVHGHE